MPADDIFFIADDLLLETMFQEQAWGLFLIG